ncbi:Bifunctional epoxide hydrolase 2, partial [Linderina macrospora]
RSIRDVEKQKRSSLVTLGQLDYYVSEYQWNGIDGPLLFYHAHQLNWEEEREAGFLMSKIEKPCMMVTAGKDNALPAKWAAHMPDFIPDLMQEHIEDSGHWVLVEQPKLCNTAFSNYLQHLEDNGFVEK